MKFSMYKSILTALLLWAGMLNAQQPVPFWSQDFAGGFPAGWTTTDASNQGVLWTWCSNPEAGNTNPGCSPIFDDALNLQIPFQATTAANGFMTLDSDEPGQLSTNHRSRLTTSVIDCSGKPAVFVQFQTHAGRYVVDLADGALLQVSNDGGTTWTDFVVFPEFRERWTPNPSEPVIDISSVAGNQANVRLRWQWEGNWEYYWNIDDVAMYNQNPTPRNNIVLGDFFYPASSFASPVSQIAADTFGFYGYLSNPGLLTQTNVTLKAWVEEEGGNIVYQDSVVVPGLAPGVVDSAIILNNVFAPELSVGLYYINYSVRADSADQRPADNGGRVPFVVTDNTFSKENVPQSATRTSQDIAWSVGNNYRITSGLLEKYVAQTASFSFGTDPADLPIESVKGTVELFKVNDDVPANFAGFDRTQLFSGSLTWVGYADYVAPAGIQNGDLQTIDLLDLNTGLTGIELESGARYFLMMDYPTDSRQVNHFFNRDIKYVDVVSTMVFTDQWYLAGFGNDYAAVMRMDIALSSSTDEKALADNVMNVFPNPVNDVVRLKVEFEQATDATITIAQLDGRVIRYENREGLTNETLSYELPSLASGTYLARIATKEGTKTKKFVVLH